MFRIIILMVALVAGGGAAWLALSMQGRPAVATIVQAPSVPMQDVLVAVSDLGPGQPLVAEDMRWQSWPESALNTAYIGRTTRPDALEALVGSIVRSRVIAGEPLRDEKLIPVNGGFLSAILPSGKRAVAVRISAENTAGGFVLPNDRVDVISTAARSGQGEGQTEHASHTILHNVRVLAIDQNIDERSKDEKPRDDKAKVEKAKVEKGKDEKGKSQVPFVGKTATLELDPGQVELVVAGEASGTLSLALRSALDNGELPPVARVEVPRPVVVPPVVPAVAPDVVVLRGGTTKAVEK
jgi:pilus assembly protein CpaB